MQPADCHACRLPECLCPAKPISITTEIVLVRHFVERHKVSGTGRLIPLAIDGAEIVDIGGPDAPARNELEAENQPGSYVLFPGATPISAIRDIRRLIVPDGTWAQVRRMRTRVPLLAGLRAVSLPAGEPTLRLRDPRFPGELPTAIAVARALEALGHTSSAALLTDLFGRMHEQLTRGSRRTQEYQ